MDCFIGEIRILPYNFAPSEWAFCNGAKVNKNQFQALYSIIQDIYGEFSKDFFSLPNMGTGSPGAPGNPGTGSAAIGAGNGSGLTPVKLGPKSIGQASVTLDLDQLPQHNHTMTAQASPVANSLPSPTDAWLTHGEVLLSTGNTPFSNFAPHDAARLVTLQAPLGSVGGGKDHENRQPFLLMNFCIALAGNYPIRP